jgi:flavin reductase (DIM6/NTAB) family NADH-FMN oxidoreductase RutF
VKRLIINPETLSQKEVYKLLIGSVVPRPIAWVSTVSQDGLYNLAPYSFYNVVSRNPPMLGISIGPGVGEREGTEKDTLANIRSEKEFVINVVSHSVANQMHISSGSFQRDVSEFEEVNVTPGKSSIVKPPLVKEANINMECKLEKIIPLGSDFLVIGRLVQYHIKDDLYENGRINLEKLQPVGRLAGNYHLIEKMFDLPK